VIIIETQTLEAVVPITGSMSEDQKFQITVAGVEAPVVVFENLNAFDIATDLIVEVLPI